MWLGAYGLKELTSVAEQINTSGKNMRLSAQAYITTLNLSRGEYRAAAAPDEIEDIMPLAQQLKQKFGTQIAALLDSLPDAYKNNIEEIKTQYALYEELADKTFATAKAHQNVTKDDGRQVIYDAVLAARTQAGKAMGAMTALNERLSNDNDQLSSSGEALSEKLQTLMLIIGIGGVLNGLAFGWFLSQRGIVEPIKQIVACLGSLAKGDLGTEVYGTARRDEVGDIARTTLVFKEHMVKAKELEEAEKAEHLAKEERQRKINEATNRFQSAMADIIKFVASASTELQASAQALAATAEETSKQSTAVATSSEQATANVQTVASASEEMTASIGEIAQQVARSSEIARKAVEEARQAGTSVSELVEAARKIGEVTDMISAIAEQTNLLALNATIEAARAGEAGKGFAVVASEVKNLASGSAKATEQISAQIAAVQQTSQHSADAISEICKVIEEVDQISGIISAAIQEQTAATQEISRNAVQASQGTQEVSSNIISVNDAAGSTGAAAHQVLSASQELAQHSSRLKEEFDLYVTAIQAA